MNFYLFVYPVLLLEHHGFVTTRHYKWDHLRNITSGAGRASPCRRSCASDAKLKWLFKGYCAAGTAAFLFGTFFWAFCTGKPSSCWKLTDSDGFCMRVSPFAEEILGKTERKSEKTFQTRFQSSMYTRTLFFIKNVLC